MDENGKPTNDPDEGIKGFVLPMAGFKGYGIAMLIDILAGLVSGAAFLNKVGRFYSVNNDSMNVGFCCIAIDPKMIMEDYDTTIVSYVNGLRNSQHVDDNPIILPGDDRIAFMKADE